MRYTFLLPAYKSTFLTEAIASILNQTFSDFNLIVSDDASPEPIKDIVESFEDKRISYRRNNVNIGAERLTEHWNSLLDACTGECLIMASDDDLYDDRFLEEINKLVQTYPEKDIYSTRSRIISKDGKILKEEPEWNNPMEFKDVCNYLTAPESILCLGNYVFRTSTLREKGGFICFPYAWKSDSATVLMMSNDGSAKTSSTLFSFRMSGENISSKKDSKAICREKITATIGFKEWSDKLLLSKDFDTSVIRKNISRKLEGEIRDYCWALSCKEFRQLYRKMQKENWFYTFRNRISFLLNRYKSRKKDNE